jgi:hypothetical protein
MSSLLSPTSVANAGEYERVYSVDKKGDADFAGRISRQQPKSSRKKSANGRLRQTDEDDGTPAKSSRRKSRSTSKSNRDVSPKKPSEVFKELASKWVENMNSSMQSLEHAMTQLQCKGPNFDDITPCKARTTPDPLDAEVDDAFVEPSGRRGRSRSLSKKKTVSSRNDEISEDDKSEFIERDAPRSSTKSTQVQSNDDEQSCASEFTDRDGTVNTEADDNTIDLIRQTVDEQRQKLVTMTTSGISQAAGWAQHLKDKIKREEAEEEIVRSSQTKKKVSSSDLCKSCKNNPYLFNF